MLRRTGERHLCLAGGVALNCVANGRIVADKVCDEVWVQPAAGDAGGALGAALAASHAAGARARTSRGARTRWLARCSVPRTRHRRSARSWTGPDIRRCG
ncbi:carbamoyltransferase N-terminal domain-containing protein [Streptomyces sp. NPDC086838]|uniref:carbamoyltransferase N-terminal domain-containing protein n=1 Tax=Streptomyces sp. NPDC086838 TaxID=3365762 RepID=UPI00380BB12E